MKDRGTRKSGIRGITIIAFASIILSSCMSSQKLETFLDSIPVRTVDFSALPDGRYEGRYTVELPFGAVAANSSLFVAVEVSGRRAHSIQITDPEGLAMVEGYRQLIGRVIENQSLDVDGISGASISSKAFFKAVETAVYR